MGSDALVLLVVSPPLGKTPSLGALSYLGRDVTDPLAAEETRRGQGETPSSEGVGGGGRDEVPRLQAEVGRSW